MIKNLSIVSGYIGQHLVSSGNFVHYVSCLHMGFFLSHFWHWKYRVVRWLNYKLETNIVAIKKAVHQWDFYFLWPESRPSIVQSIAQMYCFSLTHLLCSVKLSWQLHFSLAALSCKIKRNWNLYSLICASGLIASESHFGENKFTLVQGAINRQLSRKVDRSVIKLD